MIAFRLAQDLGTADVDALLERIPAALLLEWGEFYTWLAGGGDAAGDREAPAAVSAASPRLAHRGGRVVERASTPQAIGALFHRLAMRSAPDGAQGPA